MSSTNAVTGTILVYLKLLGALAWRNNTGAFKGQYTDKAGNSRGRYVRYGCPGSGDVLALLNSVFYSIEVKTGKDRLRPSQSEFMENVNRNGGVAFVAHSLDDVMERIPARERQV